MIQINDKSKCCGCTACMSICPLKCISMTCDEEGFLYPSVDKNKCVQCGACDKVCPIQNVVEETPFEQKAYIVRNKNKEIKKASAAGGFFYNLGSYVIKSGGVVCGVALDEAFHAVHILTDSEEDLIRFAGSKYMQSVVGNKTFACIKTNLDKGKQVLFSGTPCQVEGLLSFLKGDYSNLITVDIVCHSVPSPMIFDKYLAYVSKKYHDTIVDVHFRDKKYSYNFPTMKLVGSKKGEFYHCGMEADPFLRAFFANICDRPSCYNCHFRKQYRRSDFTIWDCNTVAKDAPEFNDGLGATKILIHTKKGHNILDEIGNSYDLIEMQTEQIINRNSAMFKSNMKSDHREAFFKDATVLDGYSLMKKWFPITWKHILKHKIRIVLQVIGLQDFMRILKHKIKTK